MCEFLAERASSLLARRSRLGHLLTPTSLLRTLASATLVCCCSRASCDVTEAHSDTSSLSQHAVATLLVATRCVTLACLTHDSFP